MVTRRDFFRSAGAAAVSTAVLSRVGAAALPEAASMDNAATQAPLSPPNGRPYTPLVTLNGWT